MKLSIVATLYYSAPYLREFHRRVTESAQRLGANYEILLVNDGSPDNVLNVALELAKTDPHLVIVDLSRNFGHHKAMMTGLAHAHGEHIFLIDSDLEEEPEWLEIFSAEMKKTGCDVVYGVQTKREGTFFKRISGQYFYKFFRWITGMDMPENMVTTRLMTRRYVDALLRFGEREIFIAGLWHITGFDQRPVMVTKHFKGKTTYSLSRQLALFVNSITSFSNRPLIMIFYCGISIFALCCIAIAWLILRWLLWATPTTGWTTVMLAILLMGGMITSFIGIVGIYLSKVYSETKQRPYTIVRDIYGRSPDKA